MTGRERRKEERYVVVGIEALLDGLPCPIVDISRSAVRLLKPGSGRVEPTADLVFRLKAPGRGRERCYRVAASLVRSTDVEMIYGYVPPCERWENMLRDRDTFIQTRLTAF